MPQNQVNSSPENQEPVATDSVNINSASVNSDVTNPTIANNKLGNSENSLQNNNPNCPLTNFTNHYVGYMDLLADLKTVMDYLDTHQGWFKRCAHPFKADAIGTTGYAMGVGRVGAFGFEVDPRVGLNLLPPDENNVYRIETIPIPDQEPQGYEVDFRAEMSLTEVPLQPTDYPKLDPAVLETYPVMTSVAWDLNLRVTLQFPAFIHRMPMDLIQKTGDGVLAFVVEKVSRSLTGKVQDDFHQTHDITPPRQIRLRRR
jgi:Protein of unknown function (DUF1997)